MKNYDQIHFNTPDSILKTLPKGNCDWPGYDKSQKEISDECLRLALCKTTYLSYHHVYLMAVLGCGHEETMKAESLKIKTENFYRNMIK